MNYEHRHKRRGCLWSIFVMIMILAVSCGALNTLTTTSVRLVELDYWGIVPRNPIGLRGILFAPLLHADYGHLFSNSFGLIMFGGLLMWRSQREFWSVVLLTTIASGLGTWLMGETGSIHVGASGVIFGLFGYLLMLAYFERSPTSILRTLLLLFFYSGMLWGALPATAGANISWEGHLFGLIGGFWAASEFWG